jgi:hypothetical protein
MATLKEAPLGTYGKTKDANLTELYKFLAVQKVGKEFVVPENAVTPPPGFDIAPAEYRIKLAYEIEAAFAQLQDGA